MQGFCKHYSTDEAALGEVAPRQPLPGLLMLKVHCIYRHVHALEALTVHTRTHHPTDEAALRKLAPRHPMQGLVLLNVDCTRWHVHTSKALTLRADAPLGRTIPQMRLH